MIVEKEIVSRTRMEAKIHIQDLADALTGFEESNKDWLVSFEADGWNVWFSIKKTLYYFLKNSGPSNTGENAANPVTFDKSTFLKDSLKYASVVGRCFFNKKGKDIIITDEANRLSKDPNGYFTEVFIDPIIASGAVTRFLYFETSGSGKLKLPAAVPRVCNEPRKIPITLIRRKYLKDQSVRIKSRLLAERINGYLHSAGSPLWVSPDIIHLMIANFLAQVKWYTWLWKKMKPRRILGVDAIPEGFIAAARKLKIPVYEFQHGFINSNKADYIIPKWALPAKDKMPIPAFICVFGDYFKNLLLKTGFWDHGEILTLGSYVVQLGRKNYHPSQQPGKIEVLWTTQPSVFTETVALMHAIGKQNLNGVEFKIKLHPRESTKNISAYNEICSVYPQVFSIEADPVFCTAISGKDILISFHSTTLLEAVAVGCPVISVATGRFEGGINNFLETDVSDIILTASTAGEIVEIIDRFMSDSAFAVRWKQMCGEKGEYLFSPDYEQNITKYFK